MASCRVLGQALLAIATIFAWSSVATAASQSPDIAVAVHREADAVVIDVRLAVDATPQEAWNVLTDYGNMARFVSGLTRSRIIGRLNGRLEVAQTSRFEFGLLDFKFESVREIELVPLREIRSTLVQGDMKASVFTTRLVTEGGATVIINHGHFIPDRWIPPIIGLAMIRAQTQRQFGDLRAEILRRQGREHRLPAGIPGAAISDSRVG